MNVFKIGGQIEALKAEATAEIPKVKAFLEKAEKAIEPIFEAIVADLLAKGTITQAQVAEAQAIEKEAEHLFAEFEPLLKKASNLG